MSYPSFGSILSAVSEELDETGDTRLQDLADILRHRGYGPFLSLLAALEMSPLGGLPGIPTLLAALILSMAIAMVLGRDRLWLPEVIGGREVPIARVRRTLKALRPWADRLDRLFRPRLAWLTSGPAARVAALGIAALCLTVPPLELIPFASTIPMAVIALTGGALFFRDGLLMALAFAAMAAAPLLIWWIAA